MTIGTQSSYNNVEHITVKHRDDNTSETFLFKIITHNIQGKIISIRCLYNFKIESCIRKKIGVS